MFAVQTTSPWTPGVLRKVCMHPFRMPRKELILTVDDKHSRIATNCSEWCIQCAWGSLSELTRSAPFPAPHVSNWRAARCGVRARRAPIIPARIGCDIADMIPTRESCCTMASAMTR